VEMELSRTRDLVSVCLDVPSLYVFSPREQGGKGMPSPYFMYTFWQLTLPLFVTEQNCAIETLQ